MPKTVKQASNILGPATVASAAKPVPPAPPATGEEHPARGGFEAPPGMKNEAVVTPPPVPRKAVKPGKTWRFVKNIDTERPIHFRDGTRYVFPQALLVTSDEVLAAKIISVAAKNHVCVEPSQS